MGSGSKGRKRRRLGSHLCKRSQSLRRIWERRKNNQGMSKSDEPNIDPGAEDSVPIFAPHANSKTYKRNIDPGAEDSRPSVASHSKRKAGELYIDLCAEDSPPSVASHSKRKALGAEDSLPEIEDMSPMADGNDTDEIREAEHEDEITEGFASVFTPDKAIKPPISLKSRRIFELSKFQEALKLVERHARSCTTSNLEIVHEHREGLISIFKLECRGCKRTFPIYTDKKTGKQTINTVAVKGAAASGIGQTQLQELFACLDIPMMGSQPFNRHAKDLRVDQANRTNEKQTRRSLISNYMQDRNLGTFKLQSPAVCNINE